MKIISRYVFRQHIGPLLFALTALTSLLMLQYVARQLGNLVGKGIPWSVIGQFFVLSLPFTVAMTMPMAVLVAVLHAFGRMASENEITAFKASGVRVTTLMTPVLIGAAFLVLGMVAFNDQILPRANHKLRVLQQDMARAKPTFALTEQVLNQVSPGFYMRIGRLDAESNRMMDVTLYDMTQPQARKTIYADSGDLSFTPDKKDLQLVLFDGYQQELPGNSSKQLQRSYFRSQAVRVKDIGASSFVQSGDDSWKGDREKSICEMQNEYVVNARDYERVRQMYIDAVRRGALPGQKTMVVPKARPATQGLARLYCNALALVFHLPTAQPSIEAQAAALTKNGFGPQPSAAAPQLTPGASPAAAGVAGTTTTNGAPANGALTPGMQAQLEAAKASLLAGSPPQASSGAVTNSQAAIASGKAVALPPSATIVPPGSPTPAVTSRNPSVAAATGAPIADSAALQRALAAAIAKSDSAAGTGSPASVPAAGVSSAVVAPPIALTSPPPAPSPATGAGTPANTAPANTSTVKAEQPTPAVSATTSTSAGSPPSPTSRAASAPKPAAQPATSSATGAILPTIARNLEPPRAAVNGAEVAAVTAQLGVVRASMDSLAVEVQKKFALSVACIVFVLFGPPIALRFPRGGVGATLGVSLVVFGLYYICLMAGETLADDGKLAPWIAMWAANVIFTVVGALLLVRIEKTADASRGGGIRAWWQDRQAKRALRIARVPLTSSATA